MSENKTNNTEANTIDSVNEPKLDLSMLDAINALYEHDQIKSNSTTNPVNVAADRFDEVRIRLAQIDNYLIDRNGSKIDPLKVENIINMNTGKVVIKWVDFNGGVIRPEQFGYPSEGYLEDWEYFPDKDDKYPEKRTLNCYNHDKASDKEMLELNHAFIWSTDSNWCGMNYLPPIGSVVVVGFKKNNMPVILGYVPTNYDKCTPFIKPGETIMKGYGNNYIHWRWSDKLDINVKSKKGEIDLDDPNKKQTYPNTIDMWMRFDCYTRNLVIDINQTDGEAKRTTLEIKPEVLKITSGKGTFSISDTDAYIKVDSSKIYIKDESVSINADKINLSDGSSNMAIKNGKVSINANNVDLNVGSSTMNIKDGNVSINSDKIDLSDNSYINNSIAINEIRLNKRLDPINKELKRLNDEVEYLKAHIASLLSIIDEAGIDNVVKNKGDE